MFEALIGISIVLIVMVLIISLGYLVFYVIGTFKLFKKCGKDGWEAIIPFYSSWVLIVDIAKLNWLWFLLTVLSLVFSNSDNSMFSSLFTLAQVLSNAVIAYNLSKKFNKDKAWFVLSIFFGGITFTLLGYSSNDKYDDTVNTSEHAFFNK